LIAEFSLGEDEFPPRSGEKVAADLDGAIRIDFGTPSPALRPYVTEINRYGHISDIIPQMSLKVLWPNPALLPRKIARVYEALRGAHERTVVVATPFGNGGVRIKSSKLVIDWSRSKRR